MIMEILTHAIVAAWVPSSARSSWPRSTAGSIPKMKEFFERLEAAERAAGIGVEKLDQPRIH
jgi:hypothetical protein